MSNPALIQGDEHLTLALGKPIVNVREVREIVYRQLTKLPGPPLMMLQPGESAHVANLNQPRGAGEVQAQVSVPIGLGQATTSFTQQMNTMLRE